MSTARTPVPLAVVSLVEEYVGKELRDAARYENSKPLDESGVFDLHTLAAQIYAQGYYDGLRVASETTRAARERANLRDTTT